MVADVNLTHLFRINQTPPIFMAPLENIVILKKYIYNEKHDILKIGKKSLWCREIQSDKKTLYSIILRRNFQGARDFMPKMYQKWWVFKPVENFGALKNF